MDEELKFWGWMWSLIALVMCCLIMTIGGCHAYEMKLFAEHGYIEKGREGNSGVIWIKP